MDRRDRPEWRYKQKAINEAAVAFRASLNDSASDRLTFVPIPPSKIKGDPLYDDRLTQMLRGIFSQDSSLDIRELVVQTANTTPAHNLDVRPRPEDIRALYRIDEELAEPTPRTIALVDDILTTGAHFRAAHSTLSTRFPAAPVIGLFIARRMPNTTNLDDFDEIEF